MHNPVYADQKQHTTLWELQTSPQHVQSVCFGHLSFPGLVESRL